MFEIEVLTVTHMTELNLLMGSHPLWCLDLQQQKMQIKKTNN